MTAAEEVEELVRTLAGEGRSIDRVARIVLLCRPELCAQAVIDSWDREADVLSFMASDEIMAIYDLSQRMARGEQ